MEQKTIAQLNADMWDAIGENKVMILDQLFQDAKHRPDVNNRLPSLTTPLMETAKTGQLELAKILIREGADPNLQAQDGGSALIYATKSNKEGIVKLLIKHTANINTQDNDGMTALMYAAQENFPTLVRLLLDAGADTSIQNEKDGNKTVLDYARKRPEIQAMLVNPQIQEHMGISGITDIVSGYLFAPERAPRTQREEKEHMQTQPTRTLTPFELQKQKDSNVELIATIKTKGSSLKQIETLLDQASLRARDIDGNTLLIIATVVNRPDVVELLLKRLHAEPDYEKLLNMSDNSGRTALWWANHMGRGKKERTAIVKMLTDAGAK